jgi:hypothetical protein
MSSRSTYSGITMDPTIDFVGSRLTKVIVDIISEAVR